MGQLKLLTKSIVFSTRSRRRFFTFVAVFAILSGATIILINYFDGFSRQELLDQRGIVLKASAFGTPSPLSLFEAESNSPVGIGINDGQTLAGASKVIFYKYVDFGSTLRIFSMNPSYPWAFSDLKPSNLAKGHFPYSTHQVLVSEDITMTLADAEGGNQIYTKPGLGTLFTLGTAITDPFELKISGIFKKPAVAEADSREWIFLTEKAFTTLIDESHLDFTENEIYIHSITVIAGGDVFLGGTYTEVDRLAAELRPLSQGGSANFNEPLFTPKSEKNELRNMMFLSLIFGLFGTFVVSTLYSYLITRFRRREVAVLKAMGYSKWSVRIVVLSEILVVAITGFAFGLLGIQAFLYLTRSSAYVFNIVFSSTALLSFLAVVLSSVPGFILITTRILGVRPIEIFRQK
ncbi:hypothetical protein CEE45_12710 [Candidatus Heimdallarchaeota archaeon B3_Heim]|nr:MAG: hypothetical protein CEE45_12710 [Candidatus Heimdallarchaeota archaeon B3_Heim]